MLKSATSRNHAADRVYRLGALLLSLAILALVIYPIVEILKATLISAGHFTIAPVRAALGDEALWNAAENSGIIIATAGTAALVIGSGFAWLNERTDASLGWLGRLLPFVPLLMPGVAVSVGWEFLANSRAGVLNPAVRSFLRIFGYHSSTGPLNLESWPGLIFMYTMFLVPFVYIIMSSTFASLDPALEEASRISGAGVFRTLRRVVIPSLRPSLGAAAVLVFIFGLSDYSIPVVIGTSARITTLSVFIVDITENYPPRTQEAACIGIMVAIIVGALWLLQRRAVKSGKHAAFTGNRGVGGRAKLGPWRNVARTLMILYVISSSLLPAVALVIVALQPYWTPSIRWSSFSLHNFSFLLSSASDVRTSLMDSLKLGFGAATIGVAIAFVLISYTRERGSGRSSWIIESVTKLTAGIPHVVIGLAFVSAFAGPPFFLYGRLTLLLLAYFVMFLPQASVAVSASYDQVGGVLREASFVNGASRGRTLVRVTLPLVRPGLVAAWALVFVLAAGELTASVLLTTSQSSVVGATFLDIWQNGTFPQLAALGTVMTVVSMTVVFIAMSQSRIRGVAEGGQV